MAITTRRFISGKVSCSCSMPGVWRAVAHNKGCVVIYHAPSSCAHITSDMDRNRHYRTMSRGEYVNYSYRAPLITTGMGKKESIFGGVDKLRQCIDYVIDTYRPTYIVVADSCLSGVIGDDSGAVCQEKEAEYGIPILHVDCHGFLDGEYYGGYIETSKKLVERFMKPFPKVENRVIVLGEKDGPQSSATLDFCELVEVFGLDAKSQFPGYSSVEEMKQMGSATYTMIMGGSPTAFASLKELAHFMSDRLGTRHFDADYPIGWKATETWVYKLAAFMHKEELAEPALQELRQRFDKGLEVYLPLLEKTSFTLCIGKVMQHFRLEWILEWCRLGHMNIDKILFLSSLSEEDMATYEAIIREWDERISVEREKDDTCLDAGGVVLTTTELDDKSLRQLFLPILPPIGPRGFLQMYKKLFMLCKRSPGKGVVFYGW